MTAPPSCRRVSTPPRVVSPYESSARWASKPPSTTHSTNATLGVLAATRPMPPRNIVSPNHSGKGISHQRRSTGSSMMAPQEDALCWDRAGGATDADVAEHRRCDRALVGRQARHVDQLARASLVEEPPFGLRRHVSSSGGCRSSVVPVGIEAPAAVAAGAPPASVRDAEREAHDRLGQVVVLVRLVDAVLGVGAVDIREAAS